MKSLSVLVLALLLLPVLQDEEEAALVRALGSDSSAERDRAAEGLEKRGLRAQGALRKAAEAGDPEVALRARDILARIRINLWRSSVAVRSDPLLPFGRADSFCVSADGKLAAGCDLNHISLWSVPDGRLLRKWPMNPKGILRIELNPEGTRLISWTITDVILWEVPSGKLLRSFRSQDQRPRMAKATPDGTRVVVAGWPSVRCIDAATGRVVWTWTPKDGSCADLAISPDGTRIAVVCSNHPQFAVLKSADGAVIQHRPVETTGSRSTIGFTADGGSVVVTNWDHDNAWRINVGDGRVEKTGVLADRYALQGRKGRYLVTKADYPKPEDESVLRMLLTGPDYDSPHQDLLTPDDRVVAAMTLNGKEVQLFEAATAKKLRDVGTNLKSYAATSDRILGGTRDGAVVLYDFEGRELKRAAPGKSPIELVAFAGPGRSLSMDEDGRVRCIELETGKELWTEEYFRFGWGPFRFHPDGRTLIGNQNERHSSTRQVVRFDAATGESVRSYGKFEGYIAGIAVSPDGTLLAASGRDGPLAVWETESGKQLWAKPAGKNARLLQFTTDSGSLVAGDDDGALVRVESRTGKAQASYRMPEKGPVREGTLSPDGRLLMAIGHEGPRLFDLKSAELLQTFEGSWQGGAAFLPGTTQALYGMPGALVDVKTGETLRKFSIAGLTRAHPDPTRTRLGALMGDRRLLLMELSTGKVLREIAAPEFATDFILGPEGAPVIFIGDQNLILGIDPAQAIPGGKNLFVVGADVEKGRVYVRGAKGIEIRSLATLERVRDVELDGIKSIQAPPGSSAAYALQDDQVILLDRETLAPLGELPPDIPKGDLDEMGGMILAGSELWEGRHGKIHMDVGKHFLKPIPGIFFGPRAEMVIVVDAEGVVTTLKPGP